MADSRPPSGKLNSNGNDPHAAVWVETSVKFSSLQLRVSLEHDKRRYAVHRFMSASKWMSSYYAVVIYDRRGFSRSQLDGPQDYRHRLETDADDDAGALGEDGCSALEVSLVCLRV
jgi:hypothetical protein